MKKTKNINDFTKYILKEAAFEKPSNDFVSAVMNKIEVENNTVLEINYKPLISKWGWFIISAMVLFAFIYLMFTGKSIQVSALSDIDLTVTNFFTEITIFKGIHISKIFSIIFVFFTVLVVFQLVVIKNYLNKNIFENYS
jgi:hypothetical protein